MALPSARAARRGKAIARRAVRPGPLPTAQLPAAPCARRGAFVPTPCQAAALGVGATRGPRAGTHPPRDVYGSWLTASHAALGVGGLDARRC